MITWIRDLLVIRLSISFDIIEQERMWVKVNC